MNHIRTSVTSGPPAFVISRDWSGNYVWLLRDDQGRVVETSTRRYDTYEACRQAIDRVRRCALTAEVS